MGEIAICLKQSISKADYKKIKELKDICTRKEKLFLKLELDFKLKLPRPQNMESLKYVNEFFCYAGRTLIGYLGIFNLGGDTGELTGMVHPLYRRKRIFSRLYHLAFEECRRRNFTKILLVCDNRSSSGLAFIRSVGAVYSFSEYEMRMQGNVISTENYDIVLRKATDSDAEEIATINYTCFGVIGYLGAMPEEEEKVNRITYMITLKSKVIGKIRTEIFGDEGFISGFGILPGYRGKGYGKQALKATVGILSKKGIRNVALEVDTQNKNALNLYKSCGFAEESATDYYETR